MNIYVAGPMSGFPDKNVDAFAKISKKYRDQGHFVFNPVENTPDGPTRTYRNCMAVDFAWICAHADMMVFLPGWENSKGACAEHALAMCLKLVIFYEPALNTEV